MRLVLVAAPFFYALRSSRANAAGALLVSGTHYDVRGTREGNARDLDVEEFFFFGLKYLVDLADHRLGGLVEFLFDTRNFIVADFAVFL